MKLLKYLANLGYGSRREVAELLDHSRVTRRDGTVLSEGDDFAHDDLIVNGEPLDVERGSLLMMHKPVGYVTSMREESKLVYELLPARFTKRSPVIAPVGRLDRDTSGILLFTDDGQLNHRITSPKTHLPKRYVARLAEPLRGDEAASFSSGTMMLERETEPLLPAKLEVIDERTAALTLTEGRYHQVRRMFAAMGNHVVALHRTSIGPLELGELPAGEWRVVTAAELAMLEGTEQWLPSETDERISLTIRRRTGAH